jgi:hypothetical protein
MLNGILINCLALVLVGLILINETNANTIKKCRPNWFRFESSCYQTIQYSTDFYTAADDCKERGSHLIIINDQNEYEFLKRFYKTDSNKNHLSWVINKF